MKCRLCLHPPPSGGVAAPTGERCFPRLTLTPSDPLLLSQGCSQPFGQLRVLLIQAMSLCAADFKPVCRGKIGPLYQPSFIVHALFVNPTNYIYFPIATCFLLSFLACFLSFAQANKEIRGGKQQTRLQRVEGTSGMAAGHRRNTNRRTALCSERRSHGRKTSVVGSHKPSHTSID